VIITEEKVEDTKNAFGKFEEKVIISLILDQPEMASILLPYLSEDLFDVPECKYTVAQIKWYADKHSVIPSRQMLHDIMLNDLTADDQYHKEIIELVTKKSDPRDIKIISSKVVDWAKKKQYGKLYSEEAIEAQQRGDYDYIEKVFVDARKIIDFKSKFMFFFKEFQSLFEEKTVKHLTTGFPGLDATVGEGGPTKKECFCWLAPTGVGKCHTLESKIIIEDLSRIFELEVELNGKIQMFRLAGFREIQTTRGKIKVCDLTETDTITEIPTWEDKGDLCL
jgi:hypothetical protein